MLGYARVCFPWFGLMLAWVPGLSHAQVPRPGVSAGPLTLFNIPAVPLHRALETYSSVTGTALIYNSPLADRQQSRPVVGLFTPEVALRMMLEGSGLAIRYNSPTDIMLVGVAESDEAARAPGIGPDGGVRTHILLDTMFVDVARGGEARPDFTSYGVLVARDLKRALARNAVTAHHVYQIQLDIWIDDHGHLERQRVAKTTGRPEFDNEIIKVVKGASIKPPPQPSMPQPLRVTISAL